MAFFHSPKLVTDGLVMYVDAANPRSYPGTGSTWYDLTTKRPCGKKKWQCHYFEA